MLNIAMDCRARRVRALSRRVLIAVASLFTTFAVLMPADFAGAQTRTFYAYALERKNCDIGAPCTLDFPKVPLNHLLEIVNVSCELHTHGDKPAVIGSAYFLDTNAKGTEDIIRHYVVPTLIGNDGVIHSIGTNSNHYALNHSIPIVVFSRRKLRAAVNFGGTVGASKLNMRCTIIGFMNAPETVPRG